MSVEALRNGSTFMRFLLGFHYWGTVLLIVGGLFAVAVGIWKELYKSSVAGWFALVALVLCAMGFQFTGNLLPMDRHDVQTVVVESGIAGSAPGLGRSLREQALAGPSFGQATLTRWTLLHGWVLPGLVVLALILSLVAFGRAKRNWALVLPLLLCAGFAFFGTPTGSAATEADFGTFNATASWYSLPLHGSLKLFQHISPSVGWIGALVLPGLFVGFLVALPLLGKKLAPTPVRVVAGAFFVYFAGVAAFVAGKPAPVVGNQDPATAPASNTHSAQVDPAVAAKGRQAFNSNQCVDCHAKDGVGDIGPDLRKERSKGRSADWIRAYILNPQAQNPSSTMPAFKGKLKEEELNSIVAFLLSR